MSLTDTDVEIIQKTWSLIRVDSVKAGIDLFRRFFEANPDYINAFPFNENDRTDMEKILKSTTLKQHAGRVMQALSTIVDHLNDPIKFEENLQKILSSHVRRQIELKQFENLKLALVGLLSDNLDREIMNDEALQAWSKAYDVILDMYRQCKDSHHQS